MYRRGAKKKTLQAQVVCVVMPCSVAVGYQCFRGSCYLCLQVEVNGSGKKE